MKSNVMKRMIVKLLQWLLVSKENRRDRIKILTNIRNKVPRNIVKFNIKIKVKKKSKENKISKAYTRHTNFLEKNFHLTPCLNFSRNFQLQSLLQITAKTLTLQVLWSNHGKISFNNSSSNLKIEILLYDFFQVL